MDLIEILCLVGAISLVTFTIVFNIVRKKKGKNSCGCACSGCKLEAQCNSNKKKSNE